MYDPYKAKRISVPALHDCVYPYPQHHIHWADGRITRMSYWCPNKAGHDEFMDRARVKALAMQARGYGDIVRAYVEDKRQPGVPWHILDMNGAGASAKPRTTVKAVKAVLADVLSIMDGRRESAEARDILAQAERLLAA